MTDDDYEKYELNLNDYDKGIRGLKQLWRMFVSHYAGDTEYADEVFAQITTKFLDRMGFHTWMHKSKPNIKSELLITMTMNENINCDFNYGEPYGYDVNTIICYSPWGVKQYCKRQCQHKNRLWLVRPVAYTKGDIVDESVNR